MHNYMCNLNKNSKRLGGWGQAYLPSKLHYHHIKSLNEPLSPGFVFFITITYLYIFYLIKPHFYIVKQGFTAVYIIFFFLLKNTDCGDSLQPPRRGGSNEYPQSIFCPEIRKISEFLSENFHFLVVKFSVYLNSHVFVMLRFLLFSRATFVDWIDIYFYKKCLKSKMACFHCLLTVH